MDYLHQLVKSMSPPEKGYFKKYTSSQGKHDYILLFDAIAAMDDYDEEKLLKKFRKKDFARHIARTKNYLYHSVIKVLLLYHEESSPKIMIRNLLNEVDLLHNRGLLNQTEKIIDKAVALAAQGEWFVQWLDALNYRRRLLSIRLHQQESEKKAAMQDFNRVAAQFHNYSAYADISEALVDIVKSSILVREQDKKEKINELMQLELVAGDESEANSDKSRIQYNYINYFIRAVLYGDHAAYPYALRLYQIIMANENLRTSNPQLLLDAYNNILTSTQSTDQAAIHEKFLNELRTTEVANSWLKVVKFQYYSAFAIKFYGNGLKKAEFTESAEEALYYLKIYRHAIKDEFRLALYVALAEGYLNFGNYDKCVDVVEQYRQNPPKNIRHDYQNYLLFFYLISQYEAGNYKLVSNLISNVGRFMKRVGEFGEIEGLMLKIFSVLLTENDKAIRSYKITELKTSIIEKVKENPGSRWHNYTSFIVPFIESKLLGIKYHTYQPVD